MSNALFKSVINNMLKDLIHLEFLIHKNRSIAEQIRTSFGNFYYYIFQLFPPVLSSMNGK